MNNILPFFVALTLNIALALPSMAIELVEVPSLIDRVKSGSLPPVAKRLPNNPLIVTPSYPGWWPGKHGGELSMLMARPKDVRMMVVYGYARLIGYTTKYGFKADLLERYEIEENRRFTFYLRKGHRWSDGRPFTAEDFRYFWEDVANNKDLAPLGPPRELIIDGEKPKFEIIDSHTIRYSWSKPNPDFLAALAGPSPLYLYRPAHYLKQFHQRYADPKKLAKMAKAKKRRNWASLHNFRDNQYKNNNPKMPSLQPWVTQTVPPAQRFVFLRNPYFHRIDEAGKQLPYIDRVVVNIAGSSIIPGKTGAGESDLQARYLNFSDYTFLKRGEKRNGYKVRLWTTAKGAHLALFPNLNANDPVWRKLFRDVRFRRALSLATNRHEINMVAFFGLTLEGNDTILPKSPLSKPEYRNSWIRFDLARANALLDEIGLTKRDDRGLRLLPDGRPMEMVIETAGESTEQSDVLELVHDSWLAAGIKTYTRPSQRDVFRNRIFAGETLMSVWSGVENALPSADVSPQEFAPTSQQQLQWPKWGQHFQSGGKVGEAPDLPAAKELLDLYKSWRIATNSKKRREIWRRILKLDSEQMFTIGILAGVPQPVVVDKNLRNVPEKGVYNWNPGAHFGIYHLDGFWFADGRQSKMKK
jgi:peptide/nickel transport system substrate-binding protein